MVWRASAFSGDGGTRGFQSREPGFWFGESQGALSPRLDYLFQSREPGFWFGENWPAPLKGRKLGFQSREPGFWFGESNRFSRMIATDGVSVP